MTNKEVIDVFFSREVEKMYDDNILDDKDYIVPQGALDNYINTILSVPYSEYISYLKEHYSDLVISSKNITQCSSFSACEEEMCIALMKVRNPGLSYLDIGKLFPTYVAANNTTAFLKFGENQIKTAAQLGLAFEYCDVWFLSCLGYVYPNLLDDVRRSVLARTLLRDPLYAKIIVDLTNGDVNLLSYMGPIKSVQTRSRRYGNVEKLASICIEECNRTGIAIGNILDTRTKIQDSTADEEMLMVAGKTLLLKYAADHSLFKDGFTVPVSQHALWKAYFNLPHNVWTGSKSINLIVDKKPFKAILNCSTNLLRQKQIMQVQYTEDSLIAQYLRSTLHVSYNFIQQIPKQSWLNNHKTVDIPDDKKEWIFVYAAKRNDTIYITSESVEKRQKVSEAPVLHNGKKDIDYYKGCFRDISISNENRKVIISKLSMILSLSEYIKWLHRCNSEITNELPILGSWEGMFIKIFTQYFNAKRTTTLFSSPFILLANEPFWKLEYSENTPATPTAGERAMMTFVNIQNTYEHVIIDNELLELLLTPQTNIELCEYVQKLLKKK